MVLHNCCCFLLCRMQVAQFLLLCTEWILITYGVPAKAPSQKKKTWNISGFDQKMKENYQTLLLRWCLFLWCCVIFHKSQNFDLTFHAHIVFAHLYIPVWWNSSSSGAKAFLKYILYYNLMHTNIHKYFLACRSGQVLCHVYQRAPEPAKSIFWRQNLLFCWSRQT